MSIQPLSNQPAALPPADLERLRHMRTSNLFSSNLRPEDAMLVRSAGFEPLSLVVGISVDHIGLQYGRWKTSMELSAPTQWLYEARHRAMTRLLAEATAVGADGVIGVTIQIQRFEFEENVVEFRVLGTAVRALPEAADLWGISDWHAGGSPFTSDLSAKQFYLLLQSGFAPLGFVLGNSVYHVAHRGFMQTVRQTNTFTEISQFSDALYEARNLAMSRMLAEADKLKAVSIYTDGDIRQYDHGWGHSTEYLAFGTAVRRLPETLEPARPTITLDVGTG